MNLLLDMNLPPSLADALRSAGFNATHWSDVGDPRATDVTVLDWAASHSYVLVTHDLDFAALLAAGGHASPSVIQLRTRDLRPARYAPLLMDALSEARAELDSGALVTVNEAEARIRILPLRRR